MAAPDPRAEELKNQGNQLFSQKHYSGAVEKYSQAIEISADQTAYYSNRCAAYQVLQMYYEACQDAEACVKLDPKWAKGWFRLGCVLMQLGREPEAVRAFDSGLKLPDAPQADLKAKKAEAERVLATYHNRKNKNGEAISSMEAAKEDGIAAYMHSDYEEAVRHFTRGIGMSTNHQRDRLVVSQCYCNRAQCLRQTQDYRGVVQDCTAAIELDNDYAKAYLRRGFALEALEKYREALADMQMVQQLAPGTVEASRAITRLTQALR